VRRGFWFAAGAGAGVYVMFKARRAAETFTPDGLRDRVAGLGVGAHLFAEEVRTGMTERETQLRHRLGLVLDGPDELPRELALSTEPTEGTH
jgi:anti-sigma factor RsiW